MTNDRDRESIDFGDYGGGGLYGYGPEFRGDIWTGTPFVAPPYYQDSQKRGEALPVYQHEQQLKYIRDRSRKLHAENEFAIAAVSNLVSYVVGSGLKYHAEPREDHTDPELVRGVQRIMDAFTSINRFPDMEAEAVWRYHRDGEFFLHCVEMTSGLLTLRFIEPEHVRSTGGGWTASDSFGIKCDPYDIVTRLGYFVVKSPLLNPQPELVDADEVIHVRANVDSGAKRGVPTSYPVESNFRRAEELMAAMSHSTKVRAKIAMIRKFTNSKRSAAQSMKDELESGEEGTQVYDPRTGSARNIEAFRLGTILNSSGNLGYEFPNAGGNSTDGINVLNAELAAIAARYVIPVNMLTMSPGALTGAFVMAAEAPATRNFERQQGIFRNVFAESRAPGYESLMWRQIRIAVNRGVLPEEVTEHVVIKADCPDIVPRDPDKRASADKTYFDMGVVSPQTLAAQLGLDWTQERRQRKDAGISSPSSVLPGTAEPALDVQPEPARLGLPTDPVAGGTEAVNRHATVQAGIDRRGTPYAYRGGEGKGRRKLPKGAAKLLTEWGCKPGGGMMELSFEQCKALGLHEAPTSDKLLSRIRQLPLADLQRLHDATGARIGELQ